MKVFKNVTETSGQLKGLTRKKKEKTTKQMVFNVTNVNHISFYPVCEEIKRVFNNIVNIMLALNVREPHNRPA